MNMFADDDHLEKCISTQHGGGGNPRLCCNGSNGLLQETYLEGCSLDQDVAHALELVLIVSGFRSTNSWLCFFDFFVLNNPAPCGSSLFVLPGGKAARSAKAAIVWAQTCISTLLRWSQVLTSVLTQSQL